MKDFFKNKKIFFKKVLDSLLKVEYTIIGYETALRLISSGKVEYEKTGKNKYKIKVSKSEKIDETMEKLIRENEELKSYIRTIQNISNQIKV